MVTELKKELERLSHQMIEPPSSYNMARRFLNALRLEIAGAVVRRGINSENNGLEAIFETAKSVEQGIFYEERQCNSYHAIKYRDESSNKPSSKFKTNKNVFEKGDTKVPTKAAKPFKLVGVSDKNIICFQCKKKGHYSTACPYDEDVQKAYAAAPDSLSLGDIRQICANAEEE